MLAGFSSSSTLLSPRHRLSLLRSDSSSSSEQLKACNLPSMSTHRLDLQPCSGFLRKDASSRSQAIVRPPSVVGLSIDSKQNSLRLLPPLQKRSLKRYAEQEICGYDNIAKRKKRRRGCLKKSGDSEDDEEDQDKKVLLLGSGKFWFLSGGDEDEEEESGRIHSHQETGGEPSGASTSSESPSNYSNPITDQETGNNGSNPTNPGESSSLAEESQNGIELISLLVACVDAVTSKNITAIHHFIARLGELSSPMGSSPICRLISYFTEALVLRVSWNWPHIFHISPPREILDVVDDDENDSTALRFLNTVTPIPKFIHFTSNEILLRVFEGKEKVHIIDFDIKQGLQWPGLFQSLASRNNPPSHIRITGVGESKQELLRTSERLSGFAERLNLSFEFHPVVDSLEDLRLWMLHVKEGESVAVNCMLQMHKVLYNGSDRALTNLLGLIRSTNPIAIVIAEQESDHNGPTLESRMAESLKYYAAVFDSLDLSLPLDSPVRVKIEAMFGREIRNIIGCEGRERYERHLRFRKWRELLGQKGNFRCLGITEREFMQCQMLLKMHSVEKYKVLKEGEEEALTISWEDQTLYTVSAWTPYDVAESS
ncbi:unnamed protein product [Cuscuta campestris]|uniref:Uncharacterized protein n=1 Tax=Cuscuta campestris TaxID=132261 RepID=A0A484NNI9_9ASTE|nr:unnamed protein product [Cuscuta campestris]